MTDRCVECGKAFTLERTGKHCKECFNIDNFVWIQESRTGRSNKYMEEE